MNKAEPRLNHPMHMQKLACAEYLSISSSNSHSISIYTADLSHWQAICDKSPDVFELPSGLPPMRDIVHESNLLDPYVPI